MKLLSRLLPVLVLSAGSLLMAVPAGAQTGERIRAYDVELRVEASGALLVTERIDYDFGKADKHGIIRSIPVRARYNNTHDRIYPLTVLSVRGSRGTPDQYEEQGNGAQLDVRIGDPDRTISGRHGYTIVYRVAGALNGFADHDELYWNAVGTEWSVPIDRASARVVVPSSINWTNCFSGSRGSRQPCAVERTDSAGALFQHRGLGPAEGLTVVVAFPVGAVPPPELVLDERWSVVRAFAVTPLTVGLFTVLLLLWLLVVGLVLRMGRDRRSRGAFGIGSRAPALAEYRPPDAIPPGLAALLVNETVRPADVTATIVDLAARGYLRIELVTPGGSDWRLVRLRDPDADLLRYERLLFDSLFASHRPGKPRSEVLMSALKYAFSERYATVREALYDEAMRRGWFTTRPDRVRKAALIGGGVVAGVGVTLTVAAAWFTHFGIVPIPIALAGAAILVGARWLPRRSAVGNALYRRITGFRGYLRNTGFAVPTRAAGGALTGGEPGYSLERYLPYAMVFGLTAQWHDAVRLIGAASQTGPYVGTVPFLGDRFADDADDFSRSWGDAITSAPASSSSGSGGSSGGGGGGGGGGSW